MCDICKENFNGLEYKIYSNEGTSSYCPNCMAQLVYNKKFPYTNGEYNSEISGSSGAIKITSGNEDYLVTSEEADRLFKHALMPDEYIALHKIHGEEYLIHDDFYDFTGVAVQPMNEEEYIKNLKDWVESGKGTNEQRDSALRYIEWYHGDN